MPEPFVEVEYELQPIVYIRREASRQEILTVEQLNNIIAAYADPLTSEQVLQLAQLCAAKWIFISFDYERELYKACNRESAAATAESLVEISRVLFSKNKLQGAIAVANESGFIGTVSEALAYIARRLAKQGDFQQTYEVMRQILDSTINDVRVDVARALLEANRLEEVLEIVAPIKLAFSDDVVAGLLFISDTLQARQDPRFDRVYQQAIELANHNSSLIQYYRIRHLISLGQLDKAILLVSALEPGDQVDAFAELAVAASRINAPNTATLIDSALTSYHDLPIKSHGKQALENIVKALILEGKINEIVNLEFPWIPSTLFYMDMMYELCQVNRLPEASALIDTIDTTYLKAFTLKWLVRYLVEQKQHDKAKAL